MGNRDITPNTLKLSARWRGMVSFTPQPLYALWKSKWCPLNRMWKGSRTCPNTAKTNIGVYPNRGLNSGHLARFPDIMLRHKKKIMNKSCTNVGRLRARSRLNLLDYNVNRQLSVSRVHWHLFQIQNYGARLKISSHVNLTVVCNPTLSKWFINEIWRKFKGSKRCTVATSISTLSRCQQAEGHDSALLKTELVFPL
jgi:hypothetical protein